MNTTKTVIFVLVVITVITFSSCHKDEYAEPTYASLTENPTVFFENQAESTEIPAQTEPFSPEQPYITETTAEPETYTHKTPESAEYTSENLPETTEPPTETSTVAESTSSKYTRTGESVFSDSPDNKYIDAVAVKYSLDKSHLAAIYTIPDTNGNIVLQFDGSRSSTGNFIRNNDTLIAIYTIDKDMNSKCASEDKNLNEFSEIEMKTMFFTVKKYLIPKFESELNS